MSLTKTVSLTKPMAGATNCPVCGAGTSRPIYSEARDPITLDNFRVVWCSACGVAYTTPPPLNIDRYYPQCYGAYGPLVRRVLSMFYGMRNSRWALLKPEGGSVLEVGCGPGLMLAAFYRRRWRLLGIERNEAVAEAARFALGVEIVTVPVERLPIGARFDLIIIFHVLEHIGEPVTLLRECAERLAPGGRLIVNVPHFSSWQSRFAGPKRLNLDTPRHLVHFTRQILAAILGRAGLRLTELTFASLEDNPYGWAESTINRLTRRGNTLARFLMALDPLGPAVLLSFVVGAVLVPPALLLALVSWKAKTGGVMEAIAVASQT